MIIHSHSVVTEDTPGLTAWERDCITRLRAEYGSCCQGDEPRAVTRQRHGTRTDPLDAFLSGYPSDLS